MSIVQWLIERYIANANKRGCPDAIRMSRSTVNRVKAEFADVVGKQWARRIRHNGPLFSMCLEIQAMQDDYVEFVWY